MIADAGLNVYHLCFSSTSHPQPVHLSLLNELPFRHFAMAMSALPLSDPKSYS